MANIHVNEIITQQFIDSLNKGIIPWRKGWINGSVLTGNYVTKKEYSLLNKMLLSHSGLHMSFKQMQEKHGNIVKKCPAHLIGKEIGKKNPYIMTQEKWESLTESARFALLSDIVTFYKVEDKDTGKKDDEGNPVMEKRFTLRYYKVIWEGYTTLYKPVEPVNTEPRIEACDALMDFYSKREGVRYIEEDGSEAFYRPATDEIHLPSASRFKYMEEFYSTAFHETTHSTGNAKRLARDMSGGFGSKSYAREELVAEIGASFLTNHFGIRTNEVEENNIAYVQNWIQRLQKDPDLIIKAAQKAQKAVDFILDGFEEPKEEPKKEEKKRGEKKVKKEKPKLTDGDLLVKMGNIVKRYVKHYRTDFTEHDVKKIANIHIEKAYGEYLWSVRECGTWLIKADDLEWKNAIENQYGDNHRWYTLTYSADGWTFKRGAR